MLRVTIDGRTHAVAPGGTILDALRGLGVAMPHLCHDDRLAPIGACRLCVVELEGRATPVPSCATQLADGMIIRTATGELETDRRTLLELLANRYPITASTAGGDSEFERELAAHGIAPRGRGPSIPVDDSHPSIRVDLERCIHCYRCERICREVEGQDVWKVLGRGEATRLVPDSGTTLRASSCVSCGACVDACPSGALVDRSLVRLGTPTSWTRTTCSYCGVGCEVTVGVRDGAVVDMRPVIDSPVNRGHLCSKGRYAFDYVASPERLTTPLVRDGSGFRGASWDEALELVASSLRSIIERHGADAVGVLGSARGTNEEAYIAQKFARVALGTNNVDCCARVCHAPSAAALRTVFGTGAATSSFDDIELAKTIVVAGSNPTSCHPVVGARIRQAVRKGANLVVVDPRETALAAIATVHLAPRPGTDLVLFHGIARVILEEGLVDEAFIAARVDGLEAFRASVMARSLEEAASYCDVPCEAIVRAARLIAIERPTISFNGIGLTEHVNGTENVIGLAEIALLTGNVGRPGTGVNPLRGQNNVQGTAHMGCEPRGLPGLVPIEEGRAAFEAAYRAPLPTNRGLDLIEMLEAARAGRVRALYAIGYDVALSSPNHARTKAALDSLELVVVQDLFLTETAKAHAHVVLPAAAGLEKDGTFMNAERRIGRVRKAKEPPAGALTDWRILCDLARTMGRTHGFEYDSAEAIWDEVRSVWPAGAGITYARLESGGIQWPCPDETHRGTTRLHETSFAHGPRASLRGREPSASDENPSDDFPLVLITGRHRFAFNAGTMTSRTDHAELRPRDVLEIAPSDATRLGLHDGQRVVVESAHGRTELPIELRPWMRTGEVFTTFHDATSFVNRLIGDGVDPKTHTPEYKRTAVRIRPVD